MRKLPHPGNRPVAGRPPRGFTVLPSCGAGLVCSVSGSGPRATAPDIRRSLRLSPRHRRRASARHRTGQQHGIATNSIANAASLAVPMPASSTTGTRAPATIISILCGWRYSLPMANPAASSSANVPPAGGHPGRRQYGRPQIRRPPIVLQPDHLTASGHRCVRRQSPRALTHWVQRLTGQLRVRPLPWRCGTPR